MTDASQHDMPESKSELRASDESLLTVNRAARTNPVISRRNLLEIATGGLVVSALGCGAAFSYANKSLLRPPGGQDEEHFLSCCIRCDRCRSACSRNAIIITGVEDGVVNIRTPQMNYRSGRLETGYVALRNVQDKYESILVANGEGFCDFCLRCVKSCPTGALLPFDPRENYIGHAVVEEPLCIAYDKTGGCRKCVDYCLFDAITLDEKQHPIVNTDLCNGCGICENICPSAAYNTYQGSSMRGINVTKVKPLETK